MNTPTKTPHSRVFGPKGGRIQQASGPAPSDTLVLADGTRLGFRPLSSGDRQRFAALFARLTPESRHRRFLSPKPALTARELAFLTDVDHVGHEAIAAIDQRDGSIVGVARHVHVANRPGVADVAIEVIDELQSMGVGTELAARLVERARGQGLTLLTATTLWDNRPARALLRRLGFRARASHGAEIELELELEPVSDCPQPAPGFMRTHPDARSPEHDSTHVNNG
jgi:RimJ/RimL family protein N-acetyltransferase